MPLPEHYVLGFDEQKIEADGIPNRYWSGLSEPFSTKDLELARQEAGSADQSVAGYPVYLDGEMRRFGLVVLLLLHASLQGSRGDLAAGACSPWDACSFRPPIARGLGRRGLPGDGSGWSSSSP